MPGLSPAISAGQAFVLEILEAQVSVITSTALGLSKCPLQEFLPGLSPSLPCSPFW